MTRLVLGRGRGAVEERGQRDAEHIGDLVEPAGADPVGALLVFLHLLECHADLLAELALRQPLLQPADADILPDQDIDRHRISCSHEVSSRQIGGRSRRG